MATGFFQITGTNISPSLIKSLQLCLERFFALPEEEKLALHIEKGGPAWRGYMPWAGEGTKGRPDQKEGLYAGAEHTEEHPLFGNPIYGRNQFPDTQIPEMRAVVLDYIDEITTLGKVLCDAMSVGLGLGHDYMRKYILDCPEPVQLFRAFRYARKESEDRGVYGIGEHSGMSAVPCSDIVVLTDRIDFGLLTILSQHGPGWQVRESYKTLYGSTDPLPDANP
jgi:isopenicillin N synthase-like dioxygenase